MYFNVFGEKVSRARYKEMVAAKKNRQELIAGGQFTRRELMKMGLLTSAGLLAPLGGLSARSASRARPENQPGSPSVTPFVVPLPIMPVKQALPGPPTPLPMINPNTAINPANHLPFEGRTQPHQAVSQFPPQFYYQVIQHDLPPEN